jgi:hypothetical protein
MPEPLIPYSDSYEPEVATGEGAHREPCFARCRVPAGRVSHAEHAERFPFPHRVDKARHANTTEV